MDARAPLVPLGHRAGLSFCTAYGDWRRAMVLMEDMRVAKRRPSGKIFLVCEGMLCVCLLLCSLLLSSSHMTLPQDSSPVGTNVCVCWLLRTWFECGFFGPYEMYLCCLIVPSA